jgi:hypothetical protein
MDSKIDAILSISAMAEISNDGSPVPLTITNR